MKIPSPSWFRRVAIATIASMSASIILTIASPSATSALASNYGIEYYIAPPFTQGSYVTTGILSENFDSLADGACPSSIGVGTVSGARCHVEASGDYGGAGVGATVSTPTVGGSAQGKYASTDSRSMTITFSGDQRYLGLWWSAGSAGNTITFFDGATEVLQLGTAELRNLLGAEPTGNAGNWETTGNLTSVGGSTYPKHHFFGNPRGFSSTTPTDRSSIVGWEPFVYIHIFTSGGLSFDSVVLSGTDGFEFDNIVVSTQNQTPATSLVRIGSVFSSVVPPAGNNPGTEGSTVQASAQPTLAATGPQSSFLPWWALSTVILGLSLLLFRLGLRKSKVTGISRPVSSTSDK